MKPINLIFLVLLLVPGSSLFAKSDNTHEKSLDNGLKVIVKEDHRAPVVIFQLWYKVGGSG